MTQTNKGANIVTRKVIDRWPKKVHVSITHTPVYLHLTAAVLQLSMYTAVQSVSRHRRRRRHSHREPGRSKAERRIRRLEKTVDSLSHGLILALTELKSGDVHTESRDRSSSSAVDGGESDFDDAVDGLSSAFTGINAREDCENSLFKL
jgi:hypothetical protein